MKRIVFLFAIFMVLFSGCTIAQKTNVMPKPKPTEAGARKVAEKYNVFTSSAKYAEAYEMLAPVTKKQISKETFIKHNQETDASQKTPVPKANIVSIQLDGNQAKVQITYATLLGAVNQIWTFAFVDGKWYRQFEADRLLVYGVNPDKIEQIEKVSFGQAFSIPGLDAVVNEAITDKVSTGEYGMRDTAQGKFVITTIAVTNTGKETFRFVPEDYLRLMDGEQRSFKAFMGPSFGYSEEIGPGMNAVLKIGFDVPETAKGFKLLVGSGNEQYIVDLGF